MSYKIGQFIGSSQMQTSSYLTPLNNIVKEDRITQASSIEKIYFKDVKFNIKNSYFSNDYNYYLKIKIKRPEVNENDNRQKNFNQEFSLFLENEDQTGSTQFLKNFFVPALLSPDSSQEKYITLELIFNPNFTFTNITLQMKRTGIDYLEIINESQSLYGRVVEIKDFECYIIKNILETIATKENQSSIELIKMGVQGPSGLLMCINGEEIRVWPSGIYQIKNGYKISFLGFIITDSDEKFFILDYQY